MTFMLPVNVLTKPKMIEKKLNEYLRSLVLQRLEKLHTGQIKLHDLTSGETLHVGASGQLVEITVHDLRFYRAIALNGDIGAGQAWAEGWWSSDNLKQTLILLLQNANVLVPQTKGAALVAEKIQKIRHMRNANTVEQAKRNIAAHYDLGNDFYTKWLDERMLYSSAVYPSDQSTLAEGQYEKIDRICRKLNLQKGQTVLEIGSGWGGFAIHAASQYGVSVHTITVSEEQYKYCISAVEKANLQSQVSVELKDYRDLKGQYDAVVSIEMIEAVGHEYLDSYFEIIANNLKPTGQALIQAITAHDQNYQMYLNRSDFIRHYIFPGGSLPSIGAIQQSLTHKTDMQITHLEDIATHYARTLDHWYENLLKNKSELPAKNQQAWFFKLWEFYLQSCSALFSQRSIGTVQILMAKPEHIAPTVINLK